MPGGLLSIRIDPLRFAGYLAATAVVWMGASKIMSDGAAPNLEPWTIALSLQLLFSAGAAVFMLTAESGLRNFGRSVYAFLALALADGLLAWVFSGVPLDEAGGRKKLYIVVTIGFFVFLSIASAMRRIVRFAEREEWNQPKLRR